MTDDLEDFKLPGGTYGFSGAKIDTLGATNYTLVNIVVDKSGSVDGFKAELIACIKEVIKACKLSPRADNLMIRLTSFDHKLDEVHGFKMLQDCNLDDYDKALENGGGATALFDSAENAVSAVSNYGKTLVDNDYDVNGIVVVITDGEDNRSAYTVNNVKSALAGAVKKETLESLVSILVGVNTGEQRMKDYLDNFHQVAGFTQYVDIANANERSLAKLAQFVSKSISAQSQALGTGGPSKSLTF
jgi:uncharacterized protein with von Willebrand factor type A (vWA) domain